MNYSVLHHRGVVHTYTQSLQLTPATPTRGITLSGKEKAKESLFRAQVSQSVCQLPYAGKGDSPVAMCRRVTAMHTCGNVWFALSTEGGLKVDAGRRLVMSALAEQENWPEHRWVYDGQKILYMPGGSGPGSFLPQHENVYEVGTAALLSSSASCCLTCSHLVLCGPQMQPDSTDFQWCLSPTHHTWAEKCGWYSGRRSPLRGPAGGGQ